MKIYDWRKFLTFIFTLLLFIILILSLIIHSKKLEVDHVEEYEVQSGETYIVQKGDTIWGISANLMKEKGIECDIRKVVYQIRVDNGIKDYGDLQIGQALYLRGAY